MVEIVETIGGLFDLIENGLFVAEQQTLADIIRIARQRDYDRATLIVDGTARVTVVL